MSNNLDSAYAKFIRTKNKYRLVIYCLMMSLRDVEQVTKICIYLNIQYITIPVRYEKYLSSFSGVEGSSFVV